MAHGTDLAPISLSCLFDASEKMKLFQVEIDHSLWRETLFKLNSTPRLLAGNLLKEADIDRRHHCDADGRLTVDASFPLDA